MQQNNKAWLKVSYKELTYLPVIVLQRKSQLRSLVVDQNAPLDNKLAYYVDDKNLLPRSGLDSLRDLLQMEYVNLPEVLHILSDTQRENVVDKKINKSKYLKIGSDLIINIRSQQSIGQQQEQLEKFYKAQLNFLLTNAKEKQKSLVILPKTQLHPHSYLNPLLTIFSKNSQFWPYRLKIQKLEVILKKLLCNVDIEIKVGFIHNGNVKESRKIVSIHLKPYISIQPFKGFIIPEQILSLGNTTKFMQIYNGPKPTGAQNSANQLQNVIDAFLSLGVEVKQINSLMKILSIILNLEELSIEKQTQGSHDFVYTTFHIKSSNPNSNNLANIVKMLNLEQNRLQNLFIMGQYDQMAEKSFKQQQQYTSLLQQLGTKQQIGTFRIHAFKYVLYEVFITQICEILNKKLCSTEYANLNGELSLQESGKNIKTMIIFSHINHSRSVKQNKSTERMQSVRLNSMFWNNGRAEINKKIQQILKCSLISSIIGVGVGSDNNKDEENEIDEVELAEEQVNSQEQLTLSAYHAKQKKMQNNFQHKKQQTWYKTLKKYLDYFENIMNFKEQLQRDRETYEYKQLKLLEKQQNLYRLYLEVRSFSLVTEICIAFFKSTYRPQIIQCIPYTFYQYLWHNFDEFHHKKSITFSSSSAVITDSIYITENQVYTEKIVDAIHKRKIFMESEEFYSKMEGLIEIGLGEFANRYLYMEVCKQKIHRMYPKPLEKLKFYPSKSDRVKVATPYINHQTTVQSLMQKIELFIQREEPQLFKLVMKKKSFKKQKFIIKIKSMEAFEQMQLQVQRQYQAIFRIQQQYLVHKNRQKTLKIVHTIAIAKKMARVIEKVERKFGNSTGMKEIKEFYVLKLKKEQQERKRREELRKARDKKFKKHFDNAEGRFNRRLGLVEVKIYNQMMIREEEEIRIEQERLRIQRQLEERRRKQQEERLEKERMQKEELERERLEKQRLEQERLERQKQQRQRLEKQEQDRQRMQIERIEKQLLQQQRLEMQIKGEANQLDKEEPEKQKNEPRPISQKINPEIKKGQQLCCQQNEEKQQKDERKMNKQANSMAASQQQLNNKENKQGFKFILDTQQNKSHGPLELKKGEKTKIQQKATEPLEEPKQNAPHKTKGPILKQLQRQQLAVDNYREISTPAEKIPTPHQSSQPPENKKDLNEESQKLPQNKQATAKPNQKQPYSPENIAHLKKEENEEPVYSISIHPSLQSMSQNKAMKEPGSQSKKSTPGSHLSVNPKTGGRNTQYQYTQKSQNLQQLTTDQLKSIIDSPNFSLDQWENVSKLKAIKSTHCDRMFSKYASITEKPPSKFQQQYKPEPDTEIMELFMHEDYLSYMKQQLGCDNTESYTKMMVNQKEPLAKPFFVDYPIQKYPTLYKDAFNAILKIGLQKNSSKKLNQLLNVFVVPLYQIFYKEIEGANSIFDEADMIPPDYSSDYNVIKDEIFFYFVKQISAAFPQKFPQKCHYAYLFGFSVFTRYFCPSPNFLYPLTHYMHFLHKEAVNKKEKKAYIQLIETIYQNLLYFVEANELFKRNPVTVFKPINPQLQITKTQSESAGYLYPRKTPILEDEINKPQEGVKPEPQKITVRLINNQTFTFPVRNQIVLTLKKKVLAECGLLSRQKCFSLYFGEIDTTYTLIDQKQKVATLFAKMQSYKQYNKQRPIYLRISHYFPFILKDVTLTRMVYMTMVSDELTMPFTAQNYVFLVAQSMAYDDYEETRIGNYLIISKQIGNKDPNMKPVQHKYKQIIPEVSKKICEFEYMKYMKSLGFFLIKCFRKEMDEDCIVGVKPFEIAIYEKCKKISSISIKRIKNVYLTEKKVVLELFYKGKQDPNQRLRMFKIIGIENYFQLFKCILFYLQNWVNA